MRDQDLLLESHGPFGSGVIGVCDVCGTRQAVIVLKKERFKVCVIDFLNKAWIGGTARPGAPLPPYESDRIWYATDLTPSGKAPAIVLSPSKVVKHPTILITPDVYGLTTQLLDAAIRFAREGFEVLLPDLGKTAGVGARDHLSLRMGFKVHHGVRMEAPRTTRLVGLFQDAMQALRARPMIDSNKAAVFGASFGGSLAIAFAEREQRLSAIALAYPMPVQPPEFLRLLTAPVLIVTPWQDRWGTASRKQFLAARSESKLDVEFADFVPVRHGFLGRDLRHYDMLVAESAWDRILAFLKSKLLPPLLKPPSPPRAASPPLPVTLPAKPATAAGATSSARTPPPSSPGESVSGPAAPTPSAT